MERSKLAWICRSGQNHFGPMASCWWACPCLIRRIYFDGDILVVSPLTAECQSAVPTSAHGRLMLTVLGGLAEFKRELIRARTGEGRALLDGLSTRRR
jgi:hypothetical protein